MFSWAGCENSQIASPPPLLLNRRAGNVAIGTVDAAIAYLGLQFDAALADIDVLAGVDRHRLARAMSAVRAGNR